MVLTALLLSSQVAYGTDYQIEVIVFKRIDEPTPTHLEEPTSSSTSYWPKNMIAIAPQRGQERVPFLWSQALMLDADPLSPINATNVVSPNSTCQQSRQTMTLIKCKNNCAKINETLC